MAYAEEEKYKMRTILVLLSLVLFAGCIDSENPITPARPGSLDPRLLGTWYWKDKDDAGFLHIGKSDTPEYITIIVIEDRKDGLLSMDQYRAHGSRIGSATYLNIHQSGSKKEKTKYIFVKYRIDKDMLLYSFADHRVKEHDIRATTIKGVLTNNHEVIAADNAAVMTAGSEEIVRYLKKHDKRVFREFRGIVRAMLPDRSLTEKKHK